MAFHLKIRDDAKDDIEKSFKWYEAKNSGLGFRFLYEVEATINYIVRYPEHFQIKSKTPYREAILKIFPYMIIYEFDEKEQAIIVYSVFPCRDNPSKKP